MADDIRNDMENKGWKLKDKSGKEFFERDRVTKLLRSIERYAKLVDVAIGHSPQIRYVALLPTSSLAKNSC